MRSVSARSVGTPLPLHQPHRMQAQPSRPGASACSPQHLLLLPSPQSVLVSGKPHLGTDRLVRILKAFRQGRRLVGRAGWAVWHFTRSASADQSPLLRLVVHPRQSPQHCKPASLPRSCREHLISLGCEVRFGTRVDDIQVKGGRVAGVRLAGELGLRRAVARQLSGDGLLQVA